MTDGSLALSDQLQIGQIVEQETTVQAITISQIMVVDVQSNREVEEVRKTPDVNEDYLLREVAQTTNVDFTGSIPATCTINSTTNGTLALKSPSALVAWGGKPSRRHTRKYQC